VEGEVIQWEIIDITNKDDYNGYKEQEHEK
jgi:hypothetical protein